MAANVTPLRKVQPRATAPEPPALPEPLWREVVGSRLRRLRRERGERLAETAARAGISPQYLSEIERGRKEPSSEMIAAVTGAFGLTLIDLTRLVTEDLRRDTVQPRQQFHGSGPVALLTLAA
ncbi:MAG TPA: helix-turn-helix transcriptional regulator [Trebonia sp.]|nr:helix-turn-helix transcriptional regulator [Trebonia sp.]